MSQPLPIPLGFDDLSMDDQIDYVTSLWDRIAADAEKVPIRLTPRELIVVAVLHLRREPGIWSQR